MLILRGIRLLFFGFTFLAIVKFSTTKWYGLLYELIHYNVSLTPPICRELYPGYLLSYLNTSQRQSSFCPFFVSTNTTFVLQGCLVKILISSEKNTPFLGFMMQAWYAHISICGTFEQDDDYKILDCFDDPQNTVIHYDGKFKTTYELYWRAPTYLLGDVNFYLTLIQNNYTYWQRWKQTWVTVVNDIAPWITSTTKRKKRKKRKNLKGEEPEDVKAALANRKKG